MDYKEKYEQALNRAKKLYEQGTITESLGYVFPELTEDEDERIRKGLIKAVSGILKGNTLYGTDVTREEALAWLEKQGEHKPTDKVKPKFKVGDWITNGDYTWEVVNVTKLDYVLRSQRNTVDDDISYVDEHFHLWTIKDAKDGDILVNGSNIFIFSHISKETRVMGYCHVNVDNNKFYIDNAFDSCFFDTCFGIIDAKFTVASQEQLELLFQKMKEAGYEWDADKKELKKIEVKTLNANKVIEWLKNTIREKKINFGEYGLYLNTNLELPYNSIEDLINDFKKDFGL